MTSGVQGFNSEISLPLQLKIAHVRRAIEYIETQAADYGEIFFNRPRVFSALFRSYSRRALHSLSPYKKHKHPDIAQQRFPDLSLGGKLNPPPEQALESKGTTRPWALQSHDNHSGWYIVWRYPVDPTKIIKRGRPVVIWRVDVAFL